MMRGADDDTETKDAERQQRDTGNTAIEITSAGETRMKVEGCEGIAGRNARGR
jgi:hypothetical protein